MVLEHQSKEVVDKISDELKVQPILDIPRALSKDIQLNYNVNPFPQIVQDVKPDIQVINKAVSDAVAGNIFTTDSTKRTYLTAINLGVNKDANNTGTITTINGALFNLSARTLFLMRYEPSTAFQNTISINFNPPLRLAKGVAVAINNENATASIDTEADVYFYEEDEPLNVSA